MPILFHSGLYITYYLQLMLLCQILKTYFNHKSTWQHPFALWNLEYWLTLHISVQGCILYYLWLFSLFSRFFALYYIFLLRWNLQHDQWLLCLYHVPQHKHSKCNVQQNIKQFTWVTTSGLQRTFMTNSETGKRCWFNSMRSNCALHAV